MRTLRIAATSIQSFCLFLNKDWMTYEKFLSDIAKTSAETPEMKLGIAFDKIMETPAKYLQISDTEEYYLCNGLRFEVDGIENALDYTNRRAIPQYKAEKEYQICGMNVELACKPDAVYGLVGWDYKASLKPLNKDKVTDYYNSYQWKSYADVIGLQKFIFLRTEFEVKDNIFYAVETVPIELYPYDSLAAEVRDFLTEFVLFIRRQNLEKYFQPKRKGVAI